MESNDIKRSSFCIGISGKYGSGKDTVAEMLLKLNPKLTVLPFAGPLKEFVALLGNIDVKSLYSDEGKEKPNAIQCSLEPFESIKKSWTYLRDTNSSKDNCKMR